MPQPRLSRADGKIDAMLSSQTIRHPHRRSPRIATIVILAFVAATGAASQAQTGPARFSGTVLDQTNAPIADVTVALTSAASQAKQEVQTDGSGRFEVADLAAGEYALEVTQPGFAVLTDTVTLARDTERTISLDVAPVHETINVSEGSRPTDAGAADRLQKFQQRAAESVQLEAERCNATRTDASGGNIIPPKKVIDVAPEYPEPLKTAKIGGETEVEGIIGSDGTVRDVRVITAAHPDLDSAAIDAISQWAFSPTLLNCIPIDVRLSVSVTFVP
jgi:TonB family protein